jgi:hypothetical protein
LSGWTELGESALAVWPRPSEGYLLELREGRLHSLAHSEV